MEKPHRLSGILKICIKNIDLRSGKSVHAYYLKLPIPPSTYMDNHFILLYSKCNFLKAAENSFRQTCTPNVFTYNTLLDAYAKRHLLAQAHDLFDEIPRPDAASFNTLISAYAARADALHALGVFNDMRRLSIRPDGFTLSSLLCACRDYHSLIRQLHCMVIRSGFDLYSSVNNTLVSVYGKGGFLKESKQVFQEGDVNVRDAVSWNSMVVVYGQHGEILKSLELIAKMNCIDSFTLASVLTAVTSAKSWSLGFQFHSTLIKRGFHVDSHVGSGLIDFYAKCGIGILDCEHAFHDVVHPDSIVWNTMISAYSLKEECSEEALSCFVKMQRAGHKPDDCSFACILRACSRLSSPRRGTQVHSLVLKSAIVRNRIQVNNSLLTMYARCGSLNDSIIHFNNMPERNEVSFSAMIAAYSQHGKGKAGLDLFKEMIEEGLSPSSIAFVSVLSACSHCGLVEEGKKFFEMMKRGFGINPSAEHYICLVDMFARAGKLNEAKEIIESMPFRSKTAAWASLLRASTKYKNTEFAEIAANQIMQLDDSNATPYIMLSNLYLSEGKWVKAAEIRNRMRNTAMRKTPGCSWIELNNEVHVFVAEDSSHSMIREIHAFLEDMFVKMKRLGYQPDLECALVKDDEIHPGERERMLMYHSEKLAVGFALLSTKPYEPIIVMKNLRICGDCHTAFKFMSSVSKRTIIVRDTLRFHSFKEEKCSCGDYW